LSFPISLHSGTLDPLADPEDVKWLLTQLKNVVFHKEYNLGHMSFTIATDMSYFDDVLKLVN
jgi:hypothetical protein